MKSISKQVYQNDIKALNQMREIYKKKVTNLCGMFYTDMVDEINLQIKFCEQCIKNIEKYEKFKN